VLRTLCLERRQPVHMPRVRITIGQAMLGVVAVALVLALLPWSLAVFSLVVPALVGRWFYRRSTRRPDVPRPSRVLSAANLGLGIYPIQFLVAFYSTWLAAWFALGHPPRPSLDDPKFIGLPVDVFYAATILHMIGAPAILGAHAILLMIWSYVELVDNPRRIVRMGPFLVLPFLLWGLTYATFRWDPGRVLYWFMD
jgi:hypothetical protein